MLFPQRRPHEPFRIIRIYRSRQDYEADCGRWLIGGWQVAEAGQFAMPPDISKSASREGDQPNFYRVACELPRTQA